MQPTDSASRCLLPYGEEEFIFVSKMPCDIVSSTASTGLSMALQWLFPFLFATCYVEGREGNAGLLSVFLLARHGERYPCHNLHHPAYPKEFVKMRCQLTETGAKQHFELGRFIRRRYSSFLTWEGFKRVGVILMNNC